MNDEAILGVIGDVHRAEPAPGEILLGGPLVPAERPGLFHGAKVAFDLLVTDRRVIAVRVAEEERRPPGREPSRPPARRDREARYRGTDPALVAAAAPGSFALGPSEVAEIVVDHTVENVGEYSSDAVLHVVVRSAAGCTVHFRAIDSGRKPDDVVALLATAFGERVRRVKVVRHGLFRRATRE